MGRDDFQGSKVKWSLLFMKLPSPSFLATCRIVLLPMAAVGLLGGCVHLEVVNPWEKGALAKPEMTFDPDRLDAAFVEHTYFSKEGTWGGASVGGGGCGCN